LQYVIVSVGKEEFKSETYKKTRNPNFGDEIFQFRIESETSVGLLKFDIWDWNFMKKEGYIGSAALQIDKLSRNTAERKTLTLTQCNSLTATLDVTVTAHNFGISEDEGRYLFHLFSFYAASSSSKEVKSLVENPLGVVLDKLKNSLYAEQFKTKRELEKFGSFLSDSNALKNSYLNIKWANTAKLVSYALFFTYGTKAEEIASNDDEITEDGDEQKIDVNIQPMLENRVTVKIVIVDQDRDNNPKKRFREFVSPLLSSLNVLPQMGFFHSALMIGPWLIEWNNSSLCVPRKCLSRAAMLSADVDAITTLTDLNKLVDDLADAIVDWNTRVHYTATGGDGKAYGNCQQFVESLCSRIGVEMPKTGPLAKCLKDLR
jgi:hypothetical protein